MKIEKYKCDNCREEIENFFHFRDVLIRRSNGKKIGRTIGFGELELKDKTFCSIDCMKDFIETKAELGDFGLRGDYYLPGEQVGADSPQGTVGK